MKSILHSILDRLRDWFSDKCPVCNRKIGANMICPHCIEYEYNRQNFTL